MTDDNIEMREIDEKPKRLLPGRRMRAAREAGHISVAEVASHLRLDPQLISALEEDNYEKLPGAAYVCGYLRSYARLLHLPENEIVQAYTQGQVVEAAIVPENVNILPPRRSNSRWIRFAILLIVMVAVAAGFLWFAEQLHLFESKHTPVAHSSMSLPEVNTTPPSSSNVPPADSQLPNLPITPPDESSAPETAPGNNSKKPLAKNLQELRLKYLADSWTEVKDAHGERLIFRLVEKNTELTLHGETPLWVLLGYAGGVEVYYQGKRFDTKDYTQNDVAIFILGKS